MIDLKLADGPWAEVSRTSQHVTLWFDWPVNQRHYMTAAEAREIARAVLDAADDLEAALADEAGL